MTPSKTQIDNTSSITPLTAQIRYTRFYINSIVLFIKIKCDQLLLKNNILFHNQEFRGNLNKLNNLHTNLFDKIFEKYITNAK